jgi:hypothetical protein
MISCMAPGLRSHSSAIGLREVTPDVPEHLYNISHALMEAMLTFGDPRRPEAKTP